jgi:hypothetical protein
MHCIRTRKGEKEKGKREKTGENGGKEIIGI